MSRISKSFYKTPCEVSWVGECPWTNTLCFGGEEGQFLIESPGAPEVGESRTGCIQLATDAINEVAFAGDLIALSSRNEVVIGKRWSPGSRSMDRYDHEVRHDNRVVIADPVSRILGRRYLSRPTYLGSKDDRDHSLLVKRWWATKCDTTR
jgi:hypothetical protein